jgi:2-dehydro-3-deoxy-L-rhamnonate dehydrogenase (NAD+)
MNAIDLKNRTAIVSGGARGIGFAIAQRMLASGATVVLWDVDAAALDKAGAALQGQGNGDGRVHAAVVDVTDAAAIARAVAADLRERCRHHRRQFAALGA